MSARRQMKLGVFLHPSGHHVAAWRHPDAQPDAGINLANYRRLAYIAERARFDLVFHGDISSVQSDDLAYIGRTSRANLFEPLTLLAALSRTTRNLGLVATASTSFNDPVDLANAVATLDHLSGGRAGWNLVTSGNDHEARNFGLQHQAVHADRYDRAREFAALFSALFDARQGAVVRHSGAHFDVAAALQAERSPQIRPVVVQAGSSEPGRRLAAETADIVFTAQQTLSDAQSFYADVKSRLPLHGRDPDDLKIMPGVFPIVGETEAEARAKYELLQSLIHPVVGLSFLSNLLGGVDLSSYPLDGPLPDELPESNVSKSRPRILLDLARREHLTIRQLYLRIAGARGHWVLIGTPTHIADRLEEFFVGKGADGFNIMPPSPHGLEDFVALVLPELRRRGLFREEYEGATLRENLGLPYRPRSRPAPAAG